MEILLIIIVALLGWIGYVLNKLNSTKKESEECVNLDNEILSKETSMSHPIFSAQEIWDAQKRMKEYQAKGQYYLGVANAQKEAILRRHRRDHTALMELPQDYKNTALSLELAIAGMKFMSVYRQKMIEANFAVMNGKTIKETRATFYEEQEKENLIIGFEECDIDNLLTDPDRLSLEEEHTKKKYKKRLDDAFKDIKEKLAT